MSVKPYRKEFADAGTLATDGSAVRWLWFVSLPLCALVAAEEPVYRTIDVETFEGTRGPAAGWTLTFHNGAGAPHGYAVVADLEPTPQGGPRYLSVLFRAQPAMGVRIRPPAPLIVGPVVREIRFFVYGFGRGDELFLDLREPTGREYRLSAGRIDFIGWKQVALRPPPGRQGRGFRLVEGGDGLQLLGFYLRLRREASAVTEARFHLDQIQAVVRAPFRAPQPRWD